MAELERPTPTKTTRDSKLLDTLRKFGSPSGPDSPESGTTDSLSPTSAQSSPQKQAARWNLNFLRVPDVGIIPVVKAFQPALRHVVLLGCELDTATLLQIAPSDVAATAR
jgi:hypothetical protein